MTHKGWHSRGYLPHFDSAETIQFVTFRLFDSLPRAVTEMLTKQPDNLANTYESLDGGLGACWLKDPTIAALIENALLHFDGDRYRLLAWCIMPNHVHVIVEPIEGNRLEPSFRPGNRLPHTRQTMFSVGMGHSGTKITSVGSFATKGTSLVQSTMSRTIR
jgi:hypothetical protein